MGESFLANYEGGWQELLPNTNDRCTLHGINLPFHGEVATRPWSWEVDNEASAAVTFSVQCTLLPLTLQRRMSVETGKTAAAGAGHQPR